MPSRQSIPLTIDHVTIAGPDLALLEQAFSAVGLTPDYGGPHSNGITHMAFIGFRDGSYIELISSIQPGLKDDVFWGNHITGDGGPCAWAVRVADTAAEAARLAALGIPVDGPAYYNRRRPDGQLVEWTLAFPGDHPAGALLPFLIADITPRSLRVQPSASVVNSPLSGVAQVVLGVDDLPSAVALFRRAYGWPAPLQTDDPRFGARLAHFAGTPVTLAAPLDGHPWLAERLARFGPSPCAYLLAADSLKEARTRFNLSPNHPWFNRQAAWFHPAALNGVRLGVVGE